MLGEAAEASALTRGKFDITFGALGDIWRFDHDQDNVVPDRQLIETRLHAHRLSRGAGRRARRSTAFIARPNMRVHLGGIGKGYAIDRAIALLKERGFTDFLIQSGGDLYVAGTNGGQPWKLGIADPRGAHEPFATLQISDGTFSTSGDYERFFMKDGVRYHHLIDPDFGEPASGCRSVTIVTNRAVHRGCAVDRRLHHGAGGGHGADREAARRRRRDRDGGQRGADLERITWPHRTTAASHQRTLGTT